MLLIFTLVIYESNMSNIFIMILQEYFGDIMTVYYILLMFVTTKKSQKI